MNNERILTEQDISDFDELFAKQFTEIEYQELKHRLESDEMFKYKIVLYKNLVSEIKREGANSQTLKERFKQLELVEGKKKTKRLTWFSISLAACFVLMIGIGLKFYQGSESKRSLSVYNTYKMSEPGLPLMMAKTDLKLLDSAMIAYSGKQYDNALLLLNKAGATDTTIYYKGVCNELLNNDHKAEILYQQVIGSKSLFISDKAKFRLALVYLKENDKRYNGLIEEISKDENSPYQQSAMRINQLLNKK